jgi:hypothetical protein
MGHLLEGLDEVADAAAPTPPADAPLADPPAAAGEEG